MIRVMVIDDSMAVRRGFSKLISKISGVELIAEASNPVDAFEEFKRVGLPDLFILDIEMPKMDGITFLKKLSQQKPIPVIICSTLVADGSDAAIDALRYGAVDIIEKPKTNLEGFFSEYQDELIEKIDAAIKAHVRIIQHIEIPKVITPKDPASLVVSKKIVAIGSSTGGVQALEKVVMGLKKNHAGVVITQHMPQGFTTSFARRLNQIAPFSYIKEAQDDDIIKDGQVLIAPGGIHMEVYSIGGVYKVKLRDFPKVNSHKPSVTVLFKSIAKVAAKNAYGYILTGMGSDGAQGLKMMRDAGARTFGESQKTAIVYGMPRVAWELGAVEEELCIDEVAANINTIGV
ncbi:MAG: chemotaxis response regulator protein-glutamate methylesterase [Sulfurimonas sp.]|nr:chemotaxis response regulator protein-glutamate methylesterase [Sulfurimonas sp.]MDD3060506.1 chemotaxis response regulator protein-glutamate methylesterase [Sulfurimonas sp.]MDD5202522.1 chemotaxis response regulator protein-glutamate methylesterase [Sulfurimonas sp.]